MLCAVKHQVNVSFSILVSLGARSPCDAIQPGVASHSRFIDFQGGTRFVVRAIRQQESQAAETAALDDRVRLDAVRSWLANGIHKFAVDPRRRFGRHDRARKLLAGDPGSDQASPGAWQSLASALHRHTVRGGMTELTPEERRVITLAYLEGRTNREIAAILGVSVSTARRRLWFALKQLDAYISRTGTWLSAIILLGVGYVIARAPRLGRSVNADWTHKVASTVAVGAMTAAAIGLTAITPDSTGPTRSSTPVTSPMIAAAPGAGLLASPELLSNLDSPQTSRMVPTDRPTGARPVDVTPGTPISETELVTDSDHPNHGCHGNPTSAPPPVPVGRHAHGSPVTHPSKGGCRV
jgi:RNA polymerase sigma factor (sigma-70 family)